MLGVRGVTSYFKEQYCNDITLKQATLNINLINSMFRFVFPLLIVITQV